ncbi:hypothetical protein ASPZODRAFT_148300 [Penicilliopsis zonata CBS 506.65]|uniref:tRNA wybutosine-synthesizing protein 4 n=1 Tax=Penicilliopsis zonata CBS 506.65 TaxID=1073090 RepID=A0A1L9SUX7_9EURO|nr:hypothetical protein ASPZODRAFT_148300 [Penicilliopsis zonata CBS 506.65]OJJ50914.1 hypothetical protein ASPZODRAFT_148300 [Penicilliopsis zonata CBS 506.65]
MEAKKKAAMAVASTKSEKEADLVMDTNSSSIVSKRSVEMLYYPKPHFFRYFVKKPQRRAPLINRGYWLRMHAIMETVRRFLAEPSDRPKYVLNLGCGFDPLPFMLLSSHRELCDGSRFVDIDYEKLMVTKKNAIQRTEEITGLLEGVEFLPDDSAVQIRSAPYIAVGCDLKNLTKLDATLQTEISPSQCSILCLAEVSLTYMDVKSANAVLSWAAKLSDDVQFCILEQFFPDGPEHPFAATMMKHFHKLRAPLFSIHEYPSLRDQERRFKNAGWTQARARSLWDLWSDDFVGDSLRRSLDEVESFDEWEEFALFASHYFLLIASTREKLPDDVAEQPVASPELNISNQFKLVHHLSSERSQRRYGALVPDSKNSIGHHGGLGRQARLASTDFYSNADEITESITQIPPRDILARMCHTVTGLANGDCLLVGGRTSPASALGDCWLREKDVWRPTHPLPVPRFRHAATRITLQPGSEQVLLYGGKTSNGDLLDSWILWDKKDGWQEIARVGSKPIARFGQCLTSVDNTSGVLFGGIQADGTIIEDFWTWSLIKQDDGSIIIKLTDQTANFKLATPLFHHLSRFGATTQSTPWGLLIIGGIVPCHLTPLDSEMLLVDVAQLQDCVVGKKAWNMTLLRRVGLGNDMKVSRPLLSGHVSCNINQDGVLILGGGAVCFSFGTFWNEGTWVLQRAEQSAQSPWILRPIPVKPAAKTLPSPSPVNSDDSIRIPRVHVRTAAEFQEIVSIGKPVVIEGSDIGPCSESWTKEYLCRAVGSDRKVVVHEAETESMDFLAKNFVYNVKEFGPFLDEVHAGGRQYLRSISTAQPSKLPANIATDFPSLSPDFRLPEELSLVAENAHSSPLRISGSVIMWLHYDVMANVYCQIRGDRRLVLYPPEDVQHLQLPPGASSSSINIFQGENGAEEPIASIPSTSPHEARLKPGDILFIPPLWLHTACSPIGSVSVAVNVFFRNMTAASYSAGRDVYGNRDVQAYERARTELSKMAKSFEALPPDMARFYLLRLAQELKDNALSGGV